MRRRIQTNFLATEPLAHNLTFPQIFDLRRRLAELGEDVVIVGAEFRGNAATGWVPRNATASRGLFSRLPFQVVDVGHIAVGQHVGIVEASSNVSIGTAAMSAAHSVVTQSLCGQARDRAAEVGAGWIPGLCCGSVAAAHIASGKRTINPLRFGICTLGSVCALIVSFSPISLFCARM